MKAFISTLFLIVTSFYAYPQNRPVADFVKANQLYITFNGRYIKFDEIKNSNTIKLFGRPLKIKNEKWEVNDAKNTRTYVYKNGKLILEDGVLSFLIIKKNDWHLVLKKGTKFSHPLSPGTNISQLKKQFPTSWENKTNKQIYVQIDQCDCNLSFSYSGDTITELGFYVNES